MERTCVLCKILLLKCGEQTEFTTVKDAKSHARIHHAQSKFLDDKNVTEEHNFHRCFPKFRHAKRSVSFTSKCRRAQLILCNSIFGKDQTISHAACKLCGLGISLRNPGGGLKTNSVIGHACVHLEIPLFECHHCKRSFGNRNSILHHLTRFHAVKPTSEDFSDKSDVFADEILKVVKRCFAGKKENIPSKEMASKIKGQMTIRNNQRHSASGSELAVQRKLFCNELIGKHVDPDGKIKCRLCSSRVVAARVMTEKPEANSWSRGTAAMQHAMYHLQKPAYGCGICAKTSATLAAIQDHMKKKHALNRGNNTHCFADRFHSEILDAMKQCYDHEKGPSDQVSRWRANMDKIKREKMIRDCKSRSKLATDRQLFFNDIVSKVIDSEGKIECRLCSQRMRIKKGTNKRCLAYSVHHSYRHLQKPLYECNSCSQSFATYSVIRVHLAKSHKLKMRKGMVKCSGDTFHAEIMAMFSQCYDFEVRTDQ